MNEQYSRDWIEDALRQEPRYIQDNGFTAGVVSALPSSRRRNRWVRLVILGTMSTVACVTGLVVAPGAKFISDCLHQLTWARALHPSLILPALIVAGLFAAAFAPFVAEKD